MCLSTTEVDVVYRPSDIQLVNVVVVCPHGWTVFVSTQWAIVAVDMRADTLLWSVGLGSPLQEVALLSGKIVHVGIHHMWLESDTFGGPAARVVLVAETTGGFLVAEVALGARTGAGLRRPTPFRRKSRTGASFVPDRRCRLMGLGTADTNEDESCIAIVPDAWALRKSWCRATGSPAGECGAIASGNMGSE